MDHVGTAETQGPAEHGVVLRQAPDLLVREAFGLMVLLDSASDGDPVTLAGTGPAIWRGFEAGAAVSDVVAAIGHRSIDRDGIGNDVRSFVTQLLEERLLIVAADDLE